MNGAPGSWAPIVRPVAGRGCGGAGVEAEGGVALLDQAGVREGAETGGEWGFGAVLGDDQSVGGEDLAATGAAEEVEGELVLGGGLGGRVEEDHVDGVGELGGFGETLEQSAGAAVFDGEGFGDFEGGEVGAQGGEGGGGVLGEPDVGGAAAERLDADGSGAGVEIEETAVGDTRGEDVEEGLAEAVAGGAGGGALGGSELARTMDSGDDAHLLMVAELGALVPGRCAVNGAPERLVGKAVYPIQQARRGPRCRAEDGVPDRMTAGTCNGRTSNGKNRSRSPSGITTKKTTARTTKDNGKNNRNGEQTMATAKNKQRQRQKQRRPGPRRVPGRAVFGGQWVRRRLWPGRRGGRGQSRGTSGCGSAGW